MQDNIDDGRFTAIKNSDIKRPRIRYHLLDELRGFAVFCMVFYHAFYTLCDLGVPYFVWFSITLFILFAILGCRISKVC